MTRAGIHVQDAALKAFLRVAPLHQERAVQSFLQRGALFLEGAMKRDASKRFGVEQAESRMQTRDPGRPKGIWSGSIKSRVSRGEASVGPDVPYAWWIEQGSEAPKGVPMTHTSSLFRGHRVVERSATEGRPALQERWFREVRKALWRST